MPPLRFCFPKSVRLARTSEFARLKRAGNSFHGKLVVLSVLKAEPESETRIGLITSRRVGGAVARNRVRRRLREIARSLRPQMSRGWHIVFVARAAAAKVEFAVLRDEVVFLLKRSLVMEVACF